MTDTKCPECGGKLADRPLARRCDDCGALARKPGIDYDHRLAPPFQTGDYELPDDVYEALEPLDGYPKGSRGGPRIYRYQRWWVAISLSDFGDLFVGPWGDLND